MATRIVRSLAFAASAMALFAFAACGDDESGDGTSGSEINISVPETIGPETTKEAPPPVSTEGGVSVPKRPSEQEQQRIRDCIAQAQGDPDKIVDCTKIANE